MVVQSVRNIDVDRLISELESKVNKKQEKKEVNGRFYEVVVNKQLLIDACDVLRHYRNSETAQEVKAEDDLK